MNKLRTTSWFLILVILLAMLVGLTMAQEAPTAAGGQLIQHEPFSGEPLTQSSEETRIELSTTGRHSLAFSSASVNLAPVAAEGASLDPGNLFDSLVVKYPVDLSEVRLPKTASPLVLEPTAGAANGLDVSGRFVGVPQPAPSPSAVGVTCTQLLQNTKLTVSSGSPAPWVILDQIVYFSDVDYVSSPHSLLFEDNDSGDSSPTQDAFAQSFSTPSNLTLVTIEYATASLESNSADYTGGNIFTVDAGGNLDQFLLGWEVGESPGSWQNRGVTITDSADLQALSGEDLAIVFFNDTNASAPGEVVFFDDITFTACADDPPDSHIIVQKKSTPSSATQKFTFNPSWSASNFQLSHGQSKTSPALAPGTYNVKELAQSGWKLSSATCDDGSNPNSISLQKGETVTCTFRNTKDAFIKIKKETNPAGATQKFTFNPSWSTANFQLSDGQSKTSPALSPGTHSVKELAQSGWNLSGITCSDGSNPNNISLQAGETVTCTFKNVKQSTSQSCGDVLVNSALDIVEFGDGTGMAEPWSILAPIVYYTKNPDTAYDGYSLFFEDGDSGDPNPGIDMLAQGFQMPGSLTEISIEYRRATLNTNSTDKVFGELWLLDDDWVLDLSNGANFVFGWPVSESEAAWGKDFGTWDDPQLLSKMTGKKMAILLFNITDGGGSKKEIVLFDEVYIEACSKKSSATHRILLPSIMKKSIVSGPLCNPPSESPADQWHSNRGSVQTGASCDSTLSNVDRADYYTFKPTGSGQYTLRLTNLPAGSEWSAMIFTDTASPAYAPGGAADGKCRITQPGNVNKQVVCTLNKNNGYFVKVSAGSTPLAGSYKMRITAP